MIFEAIPYGPKEAPAWGALGDQLEDYYGPLDECSALMVRGTDNAHLNGVILGAEGINQFMSGHDCDLSCLRPMAELAEQLGGVTLASKATAADATIKDNPDWDDQRISDFIYDSLLVHCGEDKEDNTEAAIQEHDEFAKAFASWLKASFPRVEVQDLDTYLRKKWEDVRQAHPEIWRARQLEHLGPRLNAQSVLALLNECGFQGHHTVRRPAPKIVAEAPVYFLWVETLEGPEVVAVGFADAISLIDVASWREIARGPSTPPLNSNAAWRVGQKKQFMIDRDTLVIAEPKFLRPLSKKLVYLSE